MLFGRRNAAPPLPAPKRPASPFAESLKRTIEERRAGDPLIGAKLGAKEIVVTLQEAMNSDKGVHAESLLALLGSLAGFSCVISVLIDGAQGKLPQMPNAVVSVGTKDGRTFYFGEAINARLYTDQHSVWALAAGMAQHLGATRLVDVHEIAGHVSETVGSPQFGVPRLPPGHPLGKTPAEFVREAWPALSERRNYFCPEPREWPIIFGLAAQQVMEMAKDVLDPEIALTIVMECAVPMSKIDPKTAV